jgi:hypothetical protein
MLPFRHLICLYSLWAALLCAGCAPNMVITPDVAVVPPGDFAESRSSVTLDVKTGQTYYIKGEVGVGFFVGRPHLMVVSPEITEKEIADCKLILEKKSSPDMTRPCSEIGKRSLES